MMKLEGKVAIVTGGSRGLGRAMALGFAKEGAQVVIAARTEAEMEKLPGTIYATAQEIQALGGRALPLRCDVTKEEDIAEMVTRTVDEFGRVDVLVNNAGIALPAPVIDIPLKRWELVLRVNLTGTFLCSKAVLPKMIEQRRGSIINLSSHAATMKVPGTVKEGIAGTAYGVAKAGIERFTWGLAAEVGAYNIAVNCVKPKWWISTEGTRLLNPEADLSQWDSPDLIVKAATFLAAQDATGVTGLVATDEEICLWHGL